MPLPRFSIRWMFGLTAVCAVALLVVVRAGEAGEALAIGGLVALGFAALTLLIHALFCWLLMVVSRILLPGNGIFQPRSTAPSQLNAKSAVSLVDGDPP